MPDFIAAVASEGLHTASLLEQLHLQLLEQLRD